MDVADVAPPAGGFARLAGPGFTGGSVEFDADDQVGVVRQVVDDAVISG